MEYKNIMLVHNKSIVNSRSECDTSVAFGDFRFATPVVAANMKSIIDTKRCQMFDNENWFYVYHRIDGVDDVYNFVKYANENNFRVVSISVGVKKEWDLLMTKLKSDGLRVDYVTIDVALSYNDNVVPMIKLIKYLYPSCFLICGNGSTKEWATWITGFDEVDAVKVGIGVSQACRTRQYTGFGSTTVGSLEEVATTLDKIEKGRVKIISDGGLTITDDVVWIGDVAKALVFGADMVMSGALFSRCLDSPSLINGYYGNASKTAKGNTHVEGATLNVNSNGLFTDGMMKLITESLKSSISYSGSKDIYGLKKNTRYVIIDK